MWKLDPSQMQCCLNVLRHCAEDADEMAVLLLTLRREHRTHQQTIFRAIQRLIEEMAESDTDLRNEASGAWCRDIASKCGFPPLPYI